MVSACATAAKPRTEQRELQHQVVVLEVQHEDERLGIRRRMSAGVRRTSTDCLVVMTVLAASKSATPHRAMKSRTDELRAMTL